MIERLLRELHSTKFDIREHVSPSDSLAEISGDGVEQYRLKWALARILQPESILEIGVRFGYSAATFLDASPAAHYVGIGIDGNENGRPSGAIDWAKKIIDGYNAEFIIGDGQDMPVIPGDGYDLISIRGQQDGDDTYRDLDKGLFLGRHILVDGIFRSKEMSQSCMSFLHDNRELIEYFFVIPGFAGALLIKVDEDRVRDFKKAKSGQVSLSIQEHYDSEYYLEDCSGFALYKEYLGKQLAEPRLFAVYRIADAGEGDHVLDAGCGRGEMAYACASAGATVDAVDYSESAILLANRCFDNDDQLKQRVTFHCADITNFRAGKKVDKAIASDLIEHLAPAELDRLYENLSSELKENGQFVIHTFPNLWFYKYGFAEKRRQAKSVGAWLSPEPRTYYERLMHLNEQSPRVLKEQLSRYFKHVVIWFGSFESPIGNLGRPCTITDCKNSADLFAVASNTPINIEGIMSRLTQDRLDVNERTSIYLDVVSPERVMSSGETEVLQVRITNNNQFSIQSFEPYPVHLSYHWVRDGEIIVFNGRRTRLSNVIKGGKSILTDLLIDVPDISGEYELHVVLVQENVAWFEYDRDDHASKLRISVR